MQLSVERLQKKGKYRKVNKLKPHMLSLFAHIESIQHRDIFYDDNDSLQMKILLSHLYETTATIVFCKSSAGESAKYFKKALNLLWKNADKLIENDSNVSLQDRAQIIVEQSRIKGQFLPSTFMMDYASKLYFCFEETEFEFLKSLSSSKFDEIEREFYKHDSKKNLLATFQRLGYFLPDGIYQQFFYADRFSSILHSWSRSFLYVELENDNEANCIFMSNLSRNVAIQCREVYDVHLLTEWLSTIGVLVPAWIKRKKDPESLKKALDLCHDAMSSTTLGDHLCMYEYGMIKETNNHSRPFSQIDILKNLVRAYTRMISVNSDVDLQVGDNICDQLFQLVSENADEYANSSHCLVYCAKYYASRNYFEKSMECFRQFFTMVPPDENKRQFKRYCWVVYNHARATIESDPSKEEKEEAIGQVKKVLLTNDVMADDMNVRLNGVLAKLIQM